MTEFEARPMVRLLPVHSHLIQASDLQAIVGDGVRDGVRGTQYCGLWSLASRYRVFNTFGNSFAGLLPDERRGKRRSLKSSTQRAPCQRVNRIDNVSAEFAPCIVLKRRTRSAMSSPSLRRSGPACPWV